MIKLTSFTPLPNILIDDYLANGKVTVQEYVVFTVLLRKTYGWHKERDWIRNKDLAKLCNMSDSCCKKAAASLNTKDLIDVFYQCPECKNIVDIVTYNPSEYQCNHCQCKTTPCKIYEPKLQELGFEDTEKISLLPPRTPQNCPHISPKNTPPLSSDNRGAVAKKQGGSRQKTAPCSLENSPPAPNPLSDNVPQAPKETLKRNSSKEISQSENVTKVDPEAVSENFEFSEEGEREIFYQNEEPEEEKREERDFRPINKMKPNQAETKEPNSVEKFTAGLLANVGNQTAFVEEKPTEKESKSSEKEIRELLNTCMVREWNMQTSDNDNEHIKEIMKYPYKDVEASCEDRITKNRPNMPKVFPKWVLDGLRSGIKAKKLTQLEKEAHLENELEKWYDNGNGDKVLCCDALKKLYSVVSNVGIMENRYRVVMDWCEWQCLV
jgi:phage replication O-like protein O